MDTSEIHYLTYDPDEIRKEMLDAYFEAGGDPIYPGDEKDILLRGVQQIIFLSFAGVDNALRMATLRYAVGDALDLYGEGRNCYRIQAAAATATITIHAKNTGTESVIPAGTAIAMDNGEIRFALDESVTLSGAEEDITAAITCMTEGSSGNALRAGDGMQFLASWEGVESVTCASDATGGQDREQDEAYRTRIRYYGLSTITTGPYEQYRAEAMSVSSHILDANPIRTADGEVTAYLITDGEEDAETIRAAVLAALNETTARPMTDSVHAEMATARSYSLHMQYTAEENKSNAAEAIAAAVEEYRAWQEETIGRAFNPDRLVALMYQAGCSRVIIGEDSEFDGGEAAYTEIAGSEYCKGTIETAVMG